MKRKFSKKDIGKRVQIRSGMRGEINDFVTCDYEEQPIEVELDDHQFIYLTNHGNDIDGNKSEFDIVKVFKKKNTKPLCYNPECYDHEKNYFGPPDFPHKYFTIEGSTTIHDGETDQILTTEEVLLNTQSDPDFEGWEDEIPKETQVNSPSVMVNISFNLDTEDGKASHDRFNRSAIVEDDIYAFSQYLREEYKYRSGEYTEEQFIILTRIKNKFHEIMDESDTKGLVL